MLETCGAGSREVDLRVRTVSLLRGSNADLYLALTGVDDWLQVNVLSVVLEREDLRVVYQLLSVAQKLHEGFSVTLFPSSLDFFYSDENKTTPDIPNILFKSDFIPTFSEMNNLFLTNNINSLVSFVVKSHHTDTPFYIFSQLWIYPLYLKLNPHIPIGRWMIYTEEFPRSRSVSFPSTCLLILRDL